MRLLIGILIKQMIKLDFSQVEFSFAYVKQVELKLNLCYNKLTDK